MEFGKKIEDAGFRAVWVPGVDDATALDALEPVLAATTQLVVATGIANIWTWEPADLAARTDQLAGSYPGRFILGLGNSHAPRVEQTGQVYAKPYSKMVSFLDEMPATRAPIVLAALGPKMLGLSRDRALGAHPYFNPPEHVMFARKILGSGPLLVSEVGAALASGDTGEAHARGYAKGYLSCQTTPTTCAASASPTRTSPRAAARGSSMRSPRMARASPSSASDSTWTPARTTWSSIWSAKAAGSRPATSARWRNCSAT